MARIQAYLTGKGVTDALYEVRVSYEPRRLHAWRDGGGGGGVTRYPVTKVLFQRRKKNMAANPKVYITAFGAL